jgi:hypothetical protein
MHAAEKIIEIGLRVLVQRFVEMWAKPEDRPFRRFADFGNCGGVSSPCRRNGICEPKYRLHQ